MNKSAILALPLLFCVTLSAGVDPQKESAAEAQFVPVGGVLLWWGTTSEIPPGFEVCDGTVPFTKNATLQERKPDLRDRFVKCAKDVSGYRPRNALQGGSNEPGSRRTLPEPLTADQIPGHTHPIPHVHNLTDHTHGLTEHTHPLTAHTHLIGLWFAAALSAGGVQVLVQDPNPTAATESGGGGSTGPAGRGSTQPGGAGQTLASSAPSSGLNSTQNSAHSHALPASSLPAYLEMLYIIRVL